MKRLTVVLVALLLLSACSKDRYMVNPDGSKPLLFPAETVLTWPVVDGAHQVPSGNFRIYVQGTVRFGDDVRLGDGVRIGAGSFIANDAVLFPHVTVGDDSRIGPDAVLQSDIKIGNKAIIGGDVTIGSGSVIQDGASIGKRARIGNRVTVGAGARVGPGAAIGDGETIVTSNAPSASTGSQPFKTQSY